MKWCFVVILVMNLLVAIFSVSKKSAPVEIQAQEVSPAMLKILPVGWKPPIELDSGMAILPSGLSGSPPVSATGVSGVAAASGASTPLSSTQGDANLPSSSNTSKNHIGTACFEWRMMEEDKVARVKEQLSSLHLAPAQWSESVTYTDQSAERFLVYIPPLANLAKTTALAAELRDKGFDNRLIQEGGNLDGGLSLGMHSNETGANVLAARVKAAGFNRVKIMRQNQKKKTVIFTFKALDDGQVNQLVALQKNLAPDRALRHVSCSWL